MSYSSNTSSLLSIGTILNNIYRIDGYLSSGGFGNTYVATNIEFDEKVAIKEFFMRGVTERDTNNSKVSVSNTENKILFEEQIQKFKKEANRLRILNNPHIVRVHDLFEENGTAYYVMDYIDGENLSERLRRLHKPLNDKEVTGYLLQILDALECVHNKGLCHMDLKPANIMLDKNGKITLIDFGASKQCDNVGGKNTISAVSYTNGFAPREQMEQNIEKFGPWTDLYALGATIYNLLTNHKPPLPSDIDDDRSTDKHLALPMPLYISEQTKQIILLLMKTDRLDRPQSVRDFLSMLVQTEDKPTLILSDVIENVIPKIPVDKTKVINSIPSSNKRIGISNRKKDNSSSSRKWLYVMIGVLLIVLVGVFFIKVHHLEGNKQFIIDSIAPSKKDSIEQAKKDSIEQAKKTIEQYKNDSIEYARQVEIEHKKKIERMVDSYNNLIDEAENDDLFYGYFLYDITQDGLPELWIKTGTCEANYQLDVYTYNNILKHIFQDGAGHTVYLQGNGYIIAYMAHMGYAEWNKITYNEMNNKLNSICVFSETLSEEETPDDYTTPKEPIIEMYYYNNKLPIFELLN